MSGKDAWGKLYGDLWCHPKTIGLEPGPGWLWTKALSYSKGMGTYGDIGSHTLPLFRATEDDAAALVAAGLWDVTPDGWRFHDWDDYQTTRERDAEVSRKRSEAGKKGGRPRRQEKPVTSEDKHPESTLLSNVEATESKRKLEREREGEQEEELLRPPPGEPRKRGAFVYPDAFEAWWSVYPRKDDKRKALAVWKRVTRTVPNEVLVEAATRYRDDPNRDDRYTKLATTWLSAGAWENGPLPPRRGTSGRPEAGDTHEAMRRTHTAADAYRELEASGYYDQTRPTLMRRTA